MPRYREARGPETWLEFVARLKENNDDWSNADAKRILDCVMRTVKRWNIGNLAKQDVVAKTEMRLWSNRTKLYASECPQGYIGQTAKWVCHEEYRAARALRSCEREWPQEWSDVLGTDDAGDSDIADDHRGEPGYDPCETAVRSDQVRRFLDEVTDLELAVLPYLHVTQHEIAAELGIGRDAVAQRLRSIRSKCRKFMKREELD